MTSLRFHPEARAEAREAVEWYRERSSAAARGFATALDHSLRAIVEQPTAWPTWTGHAEVRRRVLRRFPFSIFYIVDDAAIIVAVAHHKRRPGYWMPRL